MEALKKYIDHKNQWDTLFGKGPSYTFPLTQKMVDDLCEALDCDLSPENLHCDGELSIQKADKKYQFYNKVADNIAEYTWKNGLIMREIWEL